MSALTSGQPPINSTEDRLDRAISKHAPLTGSTLAAAYLGAHQQTATEFGRLSYRPRAAAGFCARAARSAKQSSDGVGLRRRCGRCWNRDNRGHEVGTGSGTRAITKGGLASLTAGVALIAKRWSNARAPFVANAVVRRTPGSAIPFVEKHLCGRGAALVTAGPGERSSSGFAAASAWYPKRVPPETS